MNMFSALKKKDKPKVEKDDFIKIVKYIGKTQFCTRKKGAERFPSLTKNKKYGVTNSYTFNYVLYDDDDIKWMVSKTDFKEIDENIQNNK